MSDAVLDDDAMLARLAQCDLAGAERVHAKLMAAEDAADIAELGRTYQRLSRSLRQTLALKAKLKRDPPPPRRDEVAIRERKDALRLAARRVAWTEHEPLERPETEDEDYVGEYFRLIDTELDRDAKPDPEFSSPPLDEHVLVLCAKLDLSLDHARTWRDLPPVPAHALIDWDAEDTS